MPTSQGSSLEALQLQLRQLSQSSMFRARVTYIQTLSNPTLRELLSPTTYLFLQSQALRENVVREQALQATIARAPSSVDVRLPSVASVIPRLQVPQGARAVVAAQAVLPNRRVVKSGPSVQRRHRIGMAVAASSSSSSSAVAGAQDVSQSNCTWCSKDISRKYYRLINGEVPAKRGFSQQVTAGDNVRRICYACYCSISACVKQGATNREAVMIVQKGHQIKAGIILPNCIQCKAEIPKGAPKYRHRDVGEWSGGNLGLLDYVSCLCEECYLKQKKSPSRQTAFY